MTKQYRAAGVDIEAADRFVERITQAARATHRPEVLTGVGGFAAHVALDRQRWSNPILVSSTDGVGTKLKYAIECGRLESIGTDLVAMCVNDLACSGAEPLFFLDYFAMGKLEPERHATVVEGIAAACTAVGCALVGGETAEMPGIYQGEDFDLAGFAVGIVERDRVIDGRTIAPGHQVIGVASTGFHSNGYSLLRKICAERHIPLAAPLPGTGETVGDYLLTPTALYSPLVQSLVARHPIAGIAHITGGGLTGNIPRILPAHCQAQIDWTGWELPPAFAYFAEAGGLAVEELRTVWNCGVGLVLVVPPDAADTVCQACRAAHHPAKIIGAIAERRPSDPAIVYC